MNVTDECERLIKAWRDTIDLTSSLRNELNRAETDRRNAAVALGRWLTPGDAKAGETFCVWHGDSLISAEVITPSTTPAAGGDFRIGIRMRGRQPL